MKKCKKLSVLLLAVALLLAAIPVAMLPASAAVDATAMDIQLDFVNNNYAHHAVYASNGISYNAGAYATKEYNYLVVKTMPGSAAVATFTVPEGAAAPIFRASTVGDALWETVTATEAIDGTTRTYTIESIGAANSFLQISFPVFSTEYKLTSLAYDMGDTTLDYTSFSYSASYWFPTKAVTLTNLGAYDCTFPSATTYLYHTGQKRINIYANNELIYKTAPGSSFKLDVMRQGCTKNPEFFASPDGINWTKISTNAYYCTGTGGYDRYYRYIPSIGENNQYVKVFLDGVSASGYVSLYSASYQKPTAVVLNAAERNTTYNALVPDSSTTVDPTTLDVNVTFGPGVTNTLSYTAGGENIDRNAGTDANYGGTIHFTAAGGYAVFKTAYNSPFYTVVRNFNTTNAEAKLFVSPTGEDGSWTSVTPITERDTTVGQTNKYTIPAIGGKNQYVKVQMDSYISVLTYIKSVAYNVAERDFTMDFTKIDKTNNFTNDLYYMVKNDMGIVSYAVTGTTAAPFNANGSNLWIAEGGEVVFPVAPAASFVFNFATTESLSYAAVYVSSAKDGPWTQVTPVKTGNTQWTLYSIGMGNQFVKLRANTSYVRVASANWTKVQPVVNDVTVQDVALTTDVAATAIDATVAYDSNKLEYKGYYGAVGTATVTDNGGSLSVNVTADAATSGDWIKLVFLPKDGIQGSAMVEVTAITATGADLTVGQCPIWYETPVTEGNVLVEFDYGTTSSALDTVAEGAAGAAISYPAAPERDGYVFGGWYDMFGNPYVAKAYPASSTRVVAKWLDEQTLSVGAQITDGTTAGSEKTDLRLSSTVDSLHYAKAGFIIQIGESGTPKTRSTTTVYSILRGAGESYTPWENFSADSRYFYAFNLRQIPRSAFDTKIIVTPFWETYDGATVTGVTRELTINGLING